MIIDIAKYILHVYFMLIKWFLEKSFSSLHHVISLKYGHEQDDDTPNFSNDY